MRFVDRRSARGTLAATLALVLVLAPQKARAQEAASQPTAPPPVAPTPPTMPPVSPPAPPVPPASPAVNAVTPPARIHRLTEEEREAAYRRAEDHEPQEAPETPGRGAAFRADFKLPFTVSNLYASTLGGSVNGLQPTTNPFAPVPQLTLGFQYGRVGFGLGLGFMNVGVSIPGASLGFGGGTSTTTYSTTEVMVAPTLTYDVFQSNDHKVAFYLLGAPIFGDIILTGQSSMLPSAMIRRNASSPLGRASGLPRHGSGDVVGDGLGLLAGAWPLRGV